MGKMGQMQREHAQQVHAQQRARTTTYLQHQQMLWEAEHARQAAERSAAANERERKRLYAEARAARVAAANANLEARLDELDGLLATTLAVDDHIDLNRLKKRVTLPEFKPGRLGVPLQPPEWNRFEPPPPGSLGKVFGGETRYQQQLAAAQEAFAQARARFAAAESEREQRLAAARRRYEAHCEQLTAQVAAHNAEIDQFAAALAAAEPKAVVEYFGLVLGNSVYPDDFPQRYRLAYVPESRQIVVEYHLPTIDVIPSVREYRYVAAGDEVLTSPRPAQEIRERYADLLGQVTLRTVHELFEADRSRLVETIVFNGMVDATDPRTGQSVRPCLVTLRTTRDTFVPIVLGRIDVEACMRYLKAAVSTRPWDLVPVRPVVEFDMVDKRFVDEVDVLADLDHRPNLLTLSAAEFESLIQNLFAKMGLDTRHVSTPADGGVDCVAFDPRPIFGGKVVIHARRNRGTVDVSAVRDLFGTLHDENASKGILVTTGGYGPASFEFASGKPLELIDGSNLLNLLAEHAGVRARIDAGEPH
ncbi:restriction endonuclease [Solwaraspora sp. WMMD1047]|uniref:restriction endonuclease n=1 Tax=Solwaraspora sp. WMMD1047 TaxID=3016102 RepID=UPI002417C5D9|nr:restriction endonuclease [Solwaraspora sp. WMMD1047]MDG4831205.1 restriction endonuclease [Solwaraspora sp. WMMD1047]